MGPLVQFDLLGLFGTQTEGAVLIVAIGCGDVFAHYVGILMRVDDIVALELILVCALSLVHGQDAIPGACLLIISSTAASKITLAGVNDAVHHGCDPTRQANSMH